MEGKGKELKSKNEWWVVLPWAEQWCQHYEVIPPGIFPCLVLETALLLAGATGLPLLCQLPHVEALPPWRMCSFPSGHPQGRYGGHCWPSWADWQGRPMLREPQGQRAKDLSFCCPSHFNYQAQGPWNLVLTLYKEGPRLSCDINFKRIRNSPSWQPLI